MLVRLDPTARTVHQRKEERKHQTELLYAARSETFFNATLPNGCSIPAVFCAFLRVTMLVLNQRRYEEGGGLLRRGLASAPTNPLDLRFRVRESRGINPETCIIGTATDGPVSCIVYDARPSDCVWHTPAISIPSTPSLLPLRTPPRPCAGCTMDTEGVSKKRYYLGLGPEEDVRC
ncbi:hypothetical protein B0H19DRAFT_1055405 [Mycena capillaripes]|nr:hypothetical protein B0H19DRAFT_1055405 [Mycena capillaripes]